MLPDLEVTKAPSSFQNASDIHSQDRQGEVRKLDNISVTLNP